MDETVAGLRDLVDGGSVDSAVGLYLTGSSCVGGLRPESDLDVLLLTSEPLSADVRRLLVAHLLGHSGRRAAVRAGRPVELTSLVVDDIRPWRYPAVRDFLYGEWLRADYEAGYLPERAPDPNLPVLLTAAREHSVTLLGPPLVGLTEPVGREDLTRSMFDALPGLIEELVGDERNVLLTLARVLVTLRTGRIVPKDEAAASVVPTLPPDVRGTLDLAARAYRGEARDDWTQRHPEAAAAAAALVVLIDDLRP